MLLFNDVKNYSKLCIISICVICIAHNYQIKSLNSIDLDWSSFLLDTSLFVKEHDNACYKPNITSTLCCQLFKYLHNKHSIYSLSTNFKVFRWFPAYWSKLFALYNKNHPRNFSKRSNNAQFDTNTDENIRNNADLPFTLFVFSNK